MRLIEIHAEYVAEYVTVKDSIEQYLTETDRGTLRLFDVVEEDEAVRLDIAIDLHGDTARRMGSGTYKTSVVIVSRDDGGGELGASMESGLLHTSVVEDLETAGRPGYPGGSR
ncbi:hypothetical protein DSC45_08495 [Streptomyces sp. YIM 130001]|uniref:hypothetical protein n=1 Tax=Streptomyces sp. YIM 130001 TaxID=2259644 RepID=UPI000E64E17E|nr:hypothetical protein [Streptomyces sp. YIM 130001]RII18649.1 hypothetical protein DSC45_08495 [Streptomyces sp. YIM 130001]